MFIQQNKYLKHIKNISMPYILRTKPIKFIHKLPKTKMLDVYGVQGREDRSGRSWKYWSLKYIV